MAPIVPAGRAPGGPGLLAAILGPIGGLTGCFCCLNTIAVWGLFITSIPLTVFMSKLMLNKHRSINVLVEFQADGSVITRLEMD